MNETVEALKREALKRSGVAASRQSAANFPAQPWRRFAETPLRFTRSAIPRFNSSTLQRLND
jgi:hypothetical protein